MINQNRLAKLLGMLGSTGDGEVVNAARLANKLVRDAGLTWEQVLNGGGYTEAFVKQVASEAYQAGKADGKPKPPRKTFSGYAKYLLAHFPDELNQWETEFLESWIDKRFPPSPKQLAIFVKFSERLNVPIPPETIGFGDVAE